VVAGAVDVRERQQRRDERRVLLDRRRDEGAVRERYPDGLGLAAADVACVPEPAMPARGLQSLTAEIAGAVGPGKRRYDQFPFRPS